jgi:hypothetical protein
MRFMGGKLMSANPATFNIYVKSSSRAYCLDRCIRSLKANVRGYDKIIILDDGTCDKYLQKIAADHPGVTLSVSPRATGRQDSPAELDPARFWTSEIQKDAYDYTFILEEDTWVRSPIIVERTVRNLRLNNTVFLKMFWAGSEKICSEQDIYFKVMFDDGDLLEYYRVQLSSIWDVYKIFMVAQSIYRIDYWMNSFAAVPTWNDEVFLLQRAVEFVQRPENQSQRITFAKTEHEKIKHSTTSTSRIDSGGVGIKIKVDNLRYNEVLNECWYRGELDSMHNYPADFSDEYLLEFFKKHLQEYEVNAWLNWRRDYSAMYQSMGCTLA